MLLRFADVTKRFDRALALDAVSFEVRAGEVVLLTGANGAGKTTLLRVAATLDRTTRGDVHVGGSNTKSEGTAVRARIGFVGHEPGVYGELTVRENVEFFASFYMTRADGARAAQDVIARVGLESRSADRARALSRGLKQRVALARAIVHAPDVLLLDEPETSLDEAGRDALREIFTRTRGSGRVIMAATHDPERLHAAATRVLSLERGRIVSDKALGGASP